MSSLKIEKKIPECTQCKRLVTHCAKVARDKRRAYLQDSYWGKPVPGFGDPQAEFLIVGLAPGAHGANRTGRMFTGDSSGDWLFKALYETGFCNQPHSISAEDGLELKNIYITAAAHCAPPSNKLTPEELKRCFPFLQKTVEELTHLKTMIVLGRIAFDTVWKLLQPGGKKPSFQHGAWYEWAGFTLLASYHPSRQNTQTGKLTWKMWLEIFQKARLKDHSMSKRDLVFSLRTNVF